MLHLPIILGVKVAAAVYRRRARAQATRAAGEPTSTAGPKLEQPGIDSMPNRGGHRG